MKDIIRLRKVYKEWFASTDGYNPDTYNILRENVYLLHRDVEKSIIKIVLDRYGRNTGTLKVLEIGTAWGFRLRGFLDMGFKPSNLYGVDLLEFFIEQAKELSPEGMSFTADDARNLSYPGKSFDIILQCTAFSSITDAKIKKSIAGEMERLLKDDGIIIWIDSASARDKRKKGKTVYYQGISLRETEALFPNCEVKTYGKIYLKPFFLNLATKCRVSYFTHLFAKEKDPVVKYAMNNALSNLFLVFPFCKSHAVLSLSKKN